MMIRNRFYALSLILIFGLLLSGCDILTQSAAPTIDPLALQATVDAAVSRAMQTEAFKQTNTAAALPTNTFTFTPTLEPTVTATPTLNSTATARATAKSTKTVLTPVATKTSVPSTQKPSVTAAPADYLCTLVSTSPTSGSNININTDFDAVWKVKNSGTKAWEVSYVDLVYLSGTKMQTMGDVYDVKTAVAQGGELTLTVDMKTPSTAGKYKVSFVLKMEGNIMCTLPVKIEAVAP